MARIGIEHAIAIGEDHQQIGLDQVGNQCGQGIVVTEADLVGDTVSFSLMTGTPRSMSVRNVLRALR